ncbi:C4-dicarboxylate ABC transporter substrate-binding protein [Bradyrhizobium ontarionense]|uniref:C4-dicarboxylate ABC transporter substrate-binding protein n=1 Tax=Bradyrhizobium ontarionense TaxID=2898149 RepID=A0ABY3R284_9BRAD|nr:TAXI family TRAP transporter solute-binding subunit [Bradyrhizobium sp. A19]UFZ01441.1 C4-dicarboxylate ABC transporter substrate-binding protein [Bradyrhizobium sp. A19]
MRRILAVPAPLALAMLSAALFTPGSAALAQERTAAPLSLKPARAPEPRVPEPRVSERRTPEPRTPEPRGASDEAAIKTRMNQWTVGLAAGLPDGGFVRFASEMARTMDDGDNMRLIPMVTRGTTSNIADLLYLRGVDVAITYADAFDFYAKQAGLSNINDRIRYVLRFFISDVHIYARDEFKTLQDLKGQKIAVGTAGVAAAHTGPLIFRRLGIDIEPVPIGGPVALEKLHKREIAAMVYVASKPGEVFSGMKADPGFHFVPVPYTQQFSDFYYPTSIKAENYPALLAPDTAVETIAVPSVLAVYNWKPGSDRADRVNRFVDTLFTNLARLQQPPFHPGWKDLNLEAQVPGWQRYPYVDAVLERMKKEADVGLPPATTGSLSPQERFEAFLASQAKAPTSKAEKEELYRSFLEWSRKRQGK